MSLEINTRMAGDVAVVSLAGRVTLGEETGKFRDVIADLIEQGHVKIVLNLKDLSYADSAGLGELVGTHTAVRGAGGSLKLLQVGGHTLELLKLTRLATLFEFHDSESAALESFQ